MTPAAQLLIDLQVLGVTLAADGDRLRFSPRSAVTPELLQRLRDCKAGVLAMLQAGQPGNGYTTHGTTGQTGVVSPAIPQDAHGDALQALGADGPQDLAEMPPAAGPAAAGSDPGDALQAHGGASGPQALPGGDPLGADGCPALPGDWTEYTTPDGRRGWVRADAAGLEYHDLPGPTARRLLDEAQRLRRRYPVPDADLQARPVAPVRTWPPVVPSGIIADPIPTCSGCKRLRVVPGQPGRAAGLCFQCWISRKRS